MEGKVAGFGGEGRCSAGETLNCMVLSLAGRSPKTGLGAYYLRVVHCPLGESVLSCVRLSVG